MKYSSILEAIGNTPLIKLEKIEKHYDLTFNLYGKLERNNPSGSIKDKPAYYIVLDALNKKLINKETILLEATSGNMGISLAMIGAYLNIKVIIAMPENSSKERIQMMKAYGASVILTKKEEGMTGSIKKIEDLHRKFKNSIIASQFENEANIKAHYEITAKEIYDDLEGKVDVFLAGFGTSGTLMGCAKFFKERNPNIKIIGVEPLSSPLLTKGEIGSHKIQGIGANFIPKLFDKSLIDQIITISNEEAYELTKELAKKEGILAGISSGANIAAILKIDGKSCRNCNIVTVLPDNGERYLSVEELF